jgi:hypothetical protein
MVIYIIVIPRTNDGTNTSNKADSGENYIIGSAMKHTGNRSVQRHRAAQIGINKDE